MPERKLNDLFTVSVQVQVVQVMKTRMQSRPELHLDPGLEDASSYHIRVQTETRLISLYSALRTAYGCQTYVWSSLLVSDCQSLAAPARALAALAWKGWTTHHLDLWMHTYWSLRRETAAQLRVGVGSQSGLWKKANSISTKCRLSDYTASRLV